MLQSPQHLHQYFLMRKKEEESLYTSSVSGAVNVRDYFFPRLKIHIGREFHGLCQNFRCNCQIHDLIIKGTNSAVNTEVKKGRRQKMGGGVDMQAYILLCIGSNYGEFY